MSDVAAEEPVAGKSKKRKIVILAAIGVILMMGGGVAWKSGMISKLVPGASHPDHAARPADVPSVLEVPDVITNLDVGNQRARFIKLHVRLMLPSAADKAAAEAALPQITDAIQTYLRAVTPTDLEGADGTYRLRAALLNHIAVVIAPNRITDVLFSQLLVQ